MSKIQEYNEFFSSYDERITLTKGFKEVDFGALGEIVVETDKTPLYFKVYIPKSFPFGFMTSSIRFVCTNLEGFEHQNYDSSICLHPKPEIDFKQKLIQETLLLFNWIKKYYIDEELDADYVYLQHQKEPSCMFFDSKSINLKKGECGFFDYVDIGSGSRNHNYLALNIGKEKSSFSNYFFGRIKNKGVWIYIEKEPIIRNRLIVKYWDELSKYVDKQQSGFLYSEKKKIKTNEDYLYVMIGYKISYRTGEEIHWQCAKILPHQEITYGVKENGKWISELEHTEIIWCKSVNITYERFFGRGKLSSKITDSNILIVGAGAIGSSLAKILVRCGLKKLGLSDFDIVESGNICRSEFFLFNESEYKTSSLLGQLSFISPFVEIKDLGEILKVLPMHRDYQKVKKQLSEFDIIFDCSTDMELAFMLDKLNLDADIFNISITDEAKELVCIYGNNNIAIQKYEIFKDLAIENVEIDFYPEAGCGYPTFRANYNEINSLLNYAVNIMNQKYINNMVNTTFILESERLVGKYRIKVNEF